MTHATITRHDAICCAVRCAIAAKDGVKALAGATFDGDNKAWIVPTMHLPTLKGIFSTMTVAPEVISAYHELLRRLLCDTMTSTSRKGAIGQHLAELRTLHANGIAHVMASGWQPTPTLRPRYVVPHTPAPVPVVEDAGLALWLRSGQGAVKAEERKENVKRNVRRKKAAV